VTDSVSPTVRRRELGAHLRRLRTGRGLTVDQVAQELLCSPSKISRMETGDRGASARDIRDLAQLYGLDPGEQQHLTQLAAAGKQQAWWQPFDLPYSRFVGLETEATAIRDFALGSVPGLLQTADYAEAVVRAGKPDMPPQVVKQRIDARLARQARIIGADSPRFDAVIDEYVLHRVVGSRSIMHAQLERLLEASHLRNVTIRVVAFAAGVLPIGTHKFILLSLDSPAITDVVYIETLTGELIIDRESDLAVYNHAYGTLAGLAASVQDTRAMIISKLRDYR
jgi:transcriptional regulator with XRE-family HTH domain